MVFPRSLQDFPVEVLTIIVTFLQEDASLKPLSNVNCLFRQLCAPFRFQMCQIVFSKAGLDRLVEISHSRIAPFVKEIHYEAAEIIDPLTQDWDLFRACIYTPPEYVRDQRDGCWNSSGRNISYARIYKYFSSRSQEQQEIMYTDHDLKALCASFPRFPRLKTIRLCFVDGIKPAFKWLTEMVLDGPLSFSSHFEKMMTAMVVAKEYGILISTFEISSLTSRTVTTDPLVRDLTAKALVNIRELIITDSPGVLEYMGHIPLPSICRLELGSYWLSIPNLERFVHSHSNSLQYLHFEDVWVLDEEIDEVGVHLSLGTTKSIFDSILHIRRSGFLREITMNRQGNDRYEIREIIDL